MKKLIFGILILGLLLGSFSFTLGRENQVEINFFYSRTCPYCQKEQEFLDVLEQKYSQIKINRFDIGERETIELLKKFYQDYKVPKEKWGLVPITFSEKDYFLGFNDTIAQEIESCIERYLAGEKKKELSFYNIDVTKYSLPVLAVILGFLDGFNLCSLGALVLILGLVLALRSRQKTLIFGGLFILTTAIVYGFLIVLWYKLFSLLAPYLRILEILIGLLGIGGGIYFLRQFIKFKKQGPTCEIKPSFSSKVQNLFQESRNIFLLIGAVLLFTAIITIVEFPCSAVVPLSFAGILAGAKLPSFLYLLYIAIFIVFYMLDEIIVFLIAFLTMKIWLASSKAITWITLAEAIILFGLGLYYLL